MNKDYNCRIYSTKEPKNKKIYYISDIHLCNLINNKTKNRMTIETVLSQVVFNLTTETDENDIILINGDTSANFPVFKLFTSMLKNYKRTVIFTLGNHDVWDFPSCTFDKITDIYRNFLTSQGMYLLQNDILYLNDWEECPRVIREKEILDFTEEEMRKQVQDAKLILFGGMGFAGYNELFNAEAGLYYPNDTIDWVVEIEETQNFDFSYKKICRVFRGKPVIIMTHMPISDWHLMEDNASPYIPGFVYTSGHTHRNYSYDDGVVRVYADNQYGSGKKYDWPHLKYFVIPEQPAPNISQQKH